MKKILLVAVAVLASAILVTGCGSTATVAKSETAKEEVVHGIGDGVPVQVNYQGKNVGKKIPGWVSAEDEAEIASLPIAQGKVVFPVESQGEDIDLTRVDAEGKGAAEFARRIKMAVQTKGGSNVSGNKDERETAVKMAEEVTGFIAKTSFSGLEQIGSFWTLDKYSNGNLVYTYYVLFGMDEQLYKDQISGVFKKVNARTPEEQKALSEIEESIKSAEALLNVE